jgi:hypothetical protein
VALRILHLAGVHQVKTETRISHDTYQVYGESTGWQVTDSGIR